MIPIVLPKIMGKSANKNENAPVQADNWSYGKTIT